MQRAARHRALRDTLVERAPEPELDERGLLGLDKLPIVSDVVTLLNGKPTTVKTTSTPTPTTSTPASTPSTPADSGSGGDNGGSGGGSSSGDDSGSGSGSGSGDNSSGNGDGSSPSDGSGSGPSSPNTGNGTGNDTSSNASSAGAATSTDTSSDTSSSNGSKSSPGLLAVGAKPSEDAVTMPAGPTSFSVIGSKTIAIVGSVTFSDGLPTPSGTGTTGVGGGDPTTSTTDAAGASRSGGISTGAAAGVGVLGGLVLIALLVFGLRRRAIQKRQRRRSEWIGGTLGRSNTDDWRSGSDHATAGDSAATRSIRSSFGTTFDHSEFSITFDDNESVPQLPPMVEIRGGPATVPKGDPSSHGNGYPVSPLSPVFPSSPSVPVGLLVSIENSNIYSDASRRSSNGSNLSAQYAYDRNSGTNNPTAEVSTPLSVRPFSPSEMFAFPAPPRESQSSEALSAMASSSPSPAMLGPIPHITETLVSPPPPQTPLHPENPFADAFASAPLQTRAAAEFDAVEMIWRPFSQTLQDELTVHAGDHVKVLAVYDDGWSMVERVAASGAKGKGKAEIGLIPIDCMRRADESVGAFLAAKRVSSVDATGYTAMAT